MQLELQIDGVKELIDHLKGLVIASERAMHQSLLETAHEVAFRAESMAPRASGRLAVSIHVRDITDIRHVGVVVETGDRELLNIAANNPYYYPAAVEFGTEKMAPRPFMRPALEIMRSKIVSRCADAVSNVVLDKTVNKGLARLSDAAYDRFGGGAAEG